MLPPIAGDRPGRAGDGVRRHRAAQHDHVVRPAGRRRRRLRVGRPTRPRTRTPVAAATSAASRAQVRPAASRLVRGAGRRRAARRRRRRAPGGRGRRPARRRRPRRPGAAAVSASAANSRAVTPGRSAPVTVSRARAVAAAGDRRAAGGRVERHGSGGTPSSCRTALGPLNRERPRTVDGPGPLAVRRCDGADQVGSGSFGPCRRPVPCRPSSLAYGSCRLPACASSCSRCEQVRVVRLERRALGADPRDLDEVVPRRRRRRRPLQRVAVAPRVVAQRELPVLPRLHHVVEERDGRGARGRTSRSSRSCSAW